MINVAGRTIKVIDFEYNGFYMSTRKTITGTPGFMYPDCLYVNCHYLSHLGPQCDLYSLGSVVF